MTDELMEPGLPKAVDRTSFEAEIKDLREREKALAHESDAIAAPRLQAM